MKSSATPRSTRIRRVDMQIWPECRNAPNGGRVDGVVEVGVVEHDQRVLAAELEHDALQVPAGGLGERRPVAVEPVKLMPAHGRVRQSSSPIAAASRGACVTTLSTPAGARPRRRSRPRAGRRRRATHSDGFRTTVLPSASGAVIDRADRISAAFHGRDRADDADGAPHAHRERPGHVGRDHLADRAGTQRRPPGGTGPARSAAGTSPNPKLRRTRGRAASAISSWRCARAGRRPSGRPAAAGRAASPPRPRRRAARLDRALGIGRARRPARRDDVAA